MTTVNSVHQIKNIRKSRNKKIFKNGFNSRNSGAENK